MASLKLAIILQELMKTVSSNAYNINVSEGAWRITRAPYLYTHPWQIVMHVGGALGIPLLRDLLEGLVRQRLSYISFGFIPSYV